MHFCIMKSLYSDQSVGQSFQIMLKSHTVSAFPGSIPKFEGLHKLWDTPILSDSQQPTTLARLLINHHDCPEAIKNP